jgi:photosystem II stability/assembly factor-like uncharacterized protein
MKAFSILATIILLLLSNLSFSQWQIITSNTSSNLVDMCFINDSTGFAVGQDGIILRSTNGGNTWNQVADLKKTDQYHLQSWKRLDNCCG